MLCELKANGWKTRRPGLPSIKYIGCSNNNVAANNGLWGLSKVMSIRFAGLFCDNTGSCIMNKEQTSIASNRSNPSVIHSICTVEEVTDGRVVTTGISVTSNLQSRSRGHEFEPESYQTWGVPSTFVRSTNYTENIISSVRKSV